ncbi:MAG TPA: hypothetical protein ENJ10_02930 [Caldithrix abyssi]|uniref:Uncharacterized protein n=1 Tax=Caldithrix abyssi TaxID=187145 RepID=A0A7V1PUG8_CALAY|nr:hypothetical protein [Caldithrix abyssi]
MKKIIGILLTALMMANGQSATEALNLTSYPDGIGARAMGMGNAYSAVADDYSALYWNPAGLGQLKKTSFSVVLSHDINGQNTDYLSRNLFSDQRTTRLNSIGLAYPFEVARGSFVLGFGYQILKGLDAFNRFSAYNTQSNGIAFDFGEDGIYDFDRDVQQDYTITREGKIEAWTFGGALALSPRFTAGASVSFYGGNSDYSLNYSQTDINDLYRLTDTSLDFYAYDYKQNLRQNYNGTEVKLSGMFELSSNLKLATVITFPVAITINEDWSENDALTYDDPSVPVDEYDLGGYTFDYIVRTPYQFNLGLSFTSDMLTLSGSVDYADWSQLRYDVPDGRDAAEYNDLLLENDRIREDFQPVLSYSAGGELALPGRMLFLRGGYRYIPTADKTLGKDFDRTVYSAGLGYAVDRNTMINVAYSVGKWKNSANYIYTTQTVEENIENKNIRLGITYKF